MTDREKKICRDAAKLIDDLCNAFRVPLLPDDKATRDELERIGGDED